MKISAIETGRISAKLDSRVRAKKDLTSFGVNNNQTQPNSDIDPQKANEAIKTTFLSNVSFGGHTEHYRTTYLTSGNFTSDLAFKIDGRCWAGKYFKRIEDAVTDSWHAPRPASWVETTSCHNGKNQIYFTDEPEEAVSDDIKSQHDFIVHWREPKFLLLNKIREKYFSNYNIDDIHSSCRDIYYYHEQLKKVVQRELSNLMKIKEQQEKELAYAEEYKQKLEQNFIEAPWEKNNDLNTAAYYCSLNRDRLSSTNEKINYYNNKMENSKTQQRLATTLYSIFEEAGPLFIERDRLYKTITDGYMSTSYGNIRSKEGAFNALKEAKTDLNSLENKYSATNAWKTFKCSEFEEKENNHGWRRINEREEEKKELDNLTRKLENIVAEISRLKATIKKLEEFPAQYDSTRANYKGILDKLAKLYPKVEAFYKENAKRMLCG